MIRVRNLRKRFGHKRVLSGLDFQVEKGELVALLGPNGSGKTTLLRILSSLSRPDGGEVLVGGYQLPQEADWVRERLGFVSHQPLLYGDLTAEENLWFYGRLYNVSDYRQRAANVLDMVGLQRCGADLVRTFSRGMVQRLALGRSLLHEPQILLFDEPHTGLDQDSVRMLNDVLLHMSEQGRIVVVTSHDLAQVANLASRFDVLSRGKIVASVKEEKIDLDRLLMFYREAVRLRGGERL
ncbi:MAG: heme ABC exporter ATP-binding protein CcmA [Anaerolineales bacterium]|nr:heme ABC exporter ATP-binding protein CcmA [Anaerolineales bacterium]